jgi:glycine/D-amino acid oxidase-like deaminating enzyme
MANNTTIVVGAGIVGTSIALNLASKGFSVTLVDRTGPASGASFGNAGGIVNNSCVPTATPGIIFEVTRMLTRPLSPFSIRPDHLPRALPWFIRFLYESQQERANNNAQNLHRLTQNATRDWLRLIDNTTLNRYVNTTGWLKVYESTHSFNNTNYAREMMDRLQVPYEVLNKAEIQALEPALAPIFNYGLFQKDSLHITNPGALIETMIELMREHGGIYKNMSVEKVTAGNNSIEISEQGSSMRAEKLIIATGAYTKPLAEMIGDKISIEAERGYHMMFPRTTGSLLSRPVVNGENSFVLSPMATGMRMTSQVEIASVDAAPNYQRIRSLKAAAKNMLPDLETLEESVWMGCRPSLPDSLPVIGTSTKSDNIIYAFGHQHLGMTLGPVTAYLVAQLISGEPTEVDLHPYRIDRF